jgi:hypothetical protein
MLRLGNPEARSGRIYRPVQYGRKGQLRATRSPYGRLGLCVREMRTQWKPSAKRERQVAHVCCVSEIYNALSASARLARPQPLRTWQSATTDPISSFSVPQIPAGHPRPWVPCGSTRCDRCPN